MTSKPDQTAGTERPKTVLLCAAPGTGLSHIADSLRPKPDDSTEGNDAEQSDNTIEVWDLERYICEAFRDSDDEGKSLPVPKMSSIVMKDRGQLYRQWESSFRTVLDEIAGSHATTRIIGMHLTWYNSQWKEFYSPIDVRSITAENCHIDHVIILIDDIYDMFSRLNQDMNLYDDRSLTSVMNEIRKLSATDATNTHSDSELRIQAVESALGDLLAWRRAEMIQAENIARSLKCDLTILATKHSEESLAVLVSDVEAPRVYVSHRISELRRAHMQRRLDDLGAAGWSPPAGEVNALHHALAERGRILITPTAIDELRFENDPSTGRRRPRLTPRWPLPSRMLWKPVSGSHQHLEFLHVGVPEDNEIASHVARSLSIRISSEVWFRDHAIVEHTPNLCVYRPFFCERSLGDRSVPDWSGGVGSELTHWMTYFTTRIESLPPQNRQISRRIAFVHTDREIKDRCVYLVGSGKEEFHKTILSHVTAALEHRDSDDAIINSPGKLKSALASASLTARHHAFTRLGREAPAANILLCRVEEDEESNASELDDLADELSEFFVGDMDEQAVSKMNEIFWSFCDLAFEEAAGMRPVVYALQTIDKNTPEIRELLGLNEES